MPLPFNNFPVYEDVFPDATGNPFIDLQHDLIGGVPPGLPCNLPILNLSVAVIVFDSSGQPILNTSNPEIPELDPRLWFPSFVECRYRINDIPLAVITIPAGVAPIVDQEGRKCFGVVQRPDIILDNLSVLNRIIVLAKVAVKNSNNTRVMNIVYVLFDGLVKHFQANRSNVSGQSHDLTILAVHPLFLMTTSSMMSWFATQTKETAYYTPATTLITSDTGTGLVNSFLPITAAQIFSLRRNWDDIWGKCIYQFLTFIAKGSWIAVPTLTVGGNYAGTDPRFYNYDALTALQLIEPRDVTGTAFDYSVGGPLHLSEEIITEFNGMEGILIQNIADALFSPSALNMAMGSTFWDWFTRVVSPSFMIEMVPLIRRSFVIPILPAHNELRAILTRSEIFQIQFDGPGFSIDKHAYLGGLALVNPMTDLTGVFSSDSGTLPLFNLIGGIDVKQTLPAGPIAYMAAPKFYHNRPLIGNAIMSYYSPNTIYYNSDPVLYPPITRLLGGTADRMAHLLRVLISLESAGRKINLTTHFRLDICPGSIIGFELPILNNITVSGLVGMVRDVHIYIKSDPKETVARTTYALSHVRTAGEASLHDYFTSDNPFYLRLTNLNPFTGRSMLGNSLAIALDNTAYLVNSPNWGG
jgi:hypothetical protein